MRGGAQTIKERLDISEVISGYIKIEKAGANFKARCPFHSEKTPSFLVSPSRQSYYCFGCGAKGDVFTFVQEMEGIDFREALKQLAEKAGVELEYEKVESKSDKDKLYQVLEAATLFFENELANDKAAERYVASRGISAETVKNWRLGLATRPNDDGWRLLYTHLLSVGFDKTLIMKAGLAKHPEDSKAKEPYDVFRDRVIFPLFDPSGRVIAFSGRALSKDTEPKYLNSPDTPVFTKSHVLYGLDKAKNEIRKKNYSVLVEGQIDLVLSHQAGVKNTVAASGTAFTQDHLVRLKPLSSRLIIAFDGDDAGLKATERATTLGLSLGFEVKVAKLPKDSDPAEVIEKNVDKWKDVLRESVPAVEFFLGLVTDKERDQRKLGKEIEKKILPMVALVSSAIEQSHFISLIAKRTSIKEEALWADLRKVKTATQAGPAPKTSDKGEEVSKTKDQRELIEERLAEVTLWQKELKVGSPEAELLKKEESELKNNLESLKLKSKLDDVLKNLSIAESKKDEKSVKSLTEEIRSLHKQVKDLEERRGML